jgi:hypothetical protein
VIWLRLPNGTLTNLSHDLNVHNNVIRNVGSLVAGELTINLAGVTLLEKSGATKHVHTVSLTVPVTSSQASAESITVSAQPLASCRIQLVEQGTRATGTSRGIGVLVRDVTVELQCDDNGGVDLLLEPGRYHIYLLDNSKKRASFVITESATDTVIDFDIAADAIAE